MPFFKPYRKAEIKQYTGIINNRKKEKYLEFGSNVGRIKKIREVIIRYGSTGISKGKFFLTFGSYFQNLVGWK